MRPTRKRLILLGPLAAFLSGLIPVVAGQSPQQNAPKPTGVRTGGVYAPLRDAKNRPITAGGFVDGGPVVFEDGIRTAGLATVHHVSGPAAKDTVLAAPVPG